jgi:predicted metalloprotease with PDZ domain
MLLWYDSSSVSEGLTKEQLMSQIVSTALVEYSYYGEEEYEKQRSFLTKYMRTMIPGWTFEKSYQSLHNAIFDS